MRKILVSTILGVGIAGTANASIVSSGFLDEKLTEMTNATTLQLDNKANQSDLTALSNKIGNDWPFNSDMMPGLHYLVPEFYPPEFSLKNTSDLAHFLFGGPLESGLYASAPGLLNSMGDKIIRVGDYEFLNDKELDRFRSLTQLTNGWTSTDGTTYLGVKDLNTKIGDLPDGLTVANLYDGWKDSDGYPVVGLRILEDKNYLMYNPRTGMVNESTDPYTGRLLGMLYALFSSGYEYGDEVLAPFWYLTKQASKVGEIPHGKTAAGMIDEINTKIGTLPSGNFPIFPGYELLFPWLNQPLTYPTSLAELITAIYGNSETGVHGLLEGIIAGFGIDTDGDGIDDSNVGTLSNYSLAKNANDLANATVTKVNSIETKIGTLPTGYDSVGAALTAIKGIAEDAKAAALAAIPDPKQEGSSGKFVLTVDIVGDNATYRWEKIDREGETTTTTE